MTVIKTMRQLAAGLLLGGASCASMATLVNTYDLGTLNATVGQSNIQVLANDTVDNTFKFIAGAQPNVLGSLVGVDVLGDLALSYRFGVGAEPLWGDFTFLTTVPQDPDSGAFSLSGSASGLLAGQTYWINLTSSATQAAYSLTLAPYSVPEPGTLLLLLLALGTLAVTLQQRRGGRRPV